MKYAVDLGIWVKVRKREGGRRGERERERGRRGEGEREKRRSEGGRGGGGQRGGGWRIRWQGSGHQNTRSHHITSDIAPYVKATMVTVSQDTSRHLSGSVQGGNKVYSCIE